MSTAAEQDAQLRASLRTVLRETLAEVDPQLTAIEEVLGEEVDAGAFALGVLMEIFVRQGLDIRKVIQFLPGEVQSFMVRCRQSREHDEPGPLRHGVLTGVAGGWPPGTEVQWREINDDLVEIRLPSGGTRRVAAGNVGSPDEK